MPLETDTRVEAVVNVETADGSTAPAANDDEAYATGSNVDVNANPTDVELDKVDSANELAILVEFGAAGHVELEFQDVDRNTIVSRTPSENGDYSVSGAGQVFITAAISLPWIQVKIRDDSGGPNQASWGIYLR